MFRTKSDMVAAEIDEALAWSVLQPREVRTIRARLRGYLVSEGEAAHSMHNEPPTEVLWYGYEIQPDVIGRAESHVYSHVQ